MTVKIVTDSSADIPPGLLKELDISVVPLYVRFEEEVYKDGVTISHDEFYRRLTEGNLFPATIQPSPGDFKQMYESLAHDADGIVSIHLSEKLSGTCQSARQAAEMMENTCPIEVIDSQSMTIGLGMVCMAAARAARDGANLQETAQLARDALKDIHFLVLFDSLKYLAKGGRIGHAKSMLGTMLNIKPMLSMKDGVVIPVKMARSFSKGIVELYDYMSSALQVKGNVKELAIMYNTAPQDAEALRDRIAPLFPVEKIIMAEAGPILGTHAGPNLLGVSIRGTVPTNY